jgi:hypothetical protein
VSAWKDVRKGNQGIENLVVCTAGHRKVPRVTRFTLFMLRPLGSIHTKIGNFSAQLLEVVTGAHISKVKQSSDVGPKSGIISNRYCIRMGLQCILWTKKTEK